ncbi:thioredoxin [Chytriomyces sp. MP71]|nr:thioredoxin [Chytriomyces sp. MP71]
MVKQLTTPEEWKQVLSSDKTVVVDWTATWCGPCKMIGPVFAELESSYPSILFVKIDVDELGDASQDAGITAMPTFQVYKGGKKVDEIIGASKDKLKALLEAHK